MVKYNWVAGRDPGFLLCIEGDTVEKEIDLNIIYEYKDYPDKNSGRCDNCDSATFKSTVGGGKYIRECRNCGMKKNI